MKAKGIVRLIVAILSGFVLISTWLWGDSPHFPTPLAAFHTIRLGTILGLLGFAGLFAEWAGTAGLRDYTGRIVTPTMWFRFNPTKIPTPLGAVDAYDIGGIHNEEIGLSIGGKQGTLLAPHDACNPIGQFLVILGPPREVNLVELPPAWVQELQRKKHAAPFYIIESSANTELRKPSAFEKRHEQMMKVMTINAAEDQVRTLIRTGALMNAHHNRTVERFTRPKKIERLLDKITPDSAPNERAQQEDRS